MGDLATIQARAWANKLAKGFNTTDVPMEFGLLTEEVSEAFSAWRKNRPVGPELADVAIFLVSLAEMLGVDLAAEVDRKMAVNAARAYVRMSNGTPVKADAEPEPPPDVQAEIRADQESCGGSLNPTPDCGGERKPPGATELWWCEAHWEFHGTPVDDGEAAAFARWQRGGGISDGG